MLVAGAGSGIGRAAAVRLAVEGAIVACTDFDGAAAEATAAMLSPEHRAKVAPVLDVADEAHWAAACEALLREHGRLDALVNSAGIACAASTVETTLDDWRHVFAVNVEGAFLGTKHGILAMRRSAEDRRASQGEPGGTTTRATGSIVNVSSAAGRHAVPGASAYSASKAAVCSLSRSAAIECCTAGDAIRVNALCPGGVRTPIWHTVPAFRALVARLGSEDAAFRKVAGTGPDARLAEPEEIAAAILYLTCDESSYVTGTEFAIDGGWMP